MAVKSPPKRDDFRCELCRQRAAFHCEHDTPYRDQYLGIFDEATSGAMLENGRISKNSGVKTTNTGSTPTGSMNTGRATNTGPASTGRGVNAIVGAQPLPGRKLDNTHSKGTTKANEQKNNKKSCVIL